MDIPIISIKDFYFSTFAVTKGQSISLLGIIVLMVVVTIAVPATAGAAFLVRPLSNASRIEKVEVKTNAGENLTVLPQPLSSMVI